MHTALADLGQSVGDRVDTVERRVTSTVRDTAKDTEGRLRDVSGRVSTARRGIEDAVREEVATVLMGMRAGLSPLTNEVVHRVAELEREVETRLAERVEELNGNIAVVFEAMASLRQDLGDESDGAPALDDQD